MANDDWLERLHGLAYRFESLGVTPDLAAMSLCELWALYAFLRRLSEGANGPQQVNNGSLPAPVGGETSIEPSKLLEQQHGQQLDTGTQGTAIGADIFDLPNCDDDYVRKIVKK